MRHGSLFSGIGGFDLAAEWMGWENVFHCEWNEFGQKVLKHYWPKAISYEDINKTDFSIHRGNIDILTGGFPCQPYSSAGKRLGKEDERHLWPQMLRAIREIKPRWVVGENVYGLVNWSGGLVFHEVQSDLEAEGYEVQPYLLPAVSVNAPHKRDRIWFVAYNNSINGIGEKWELAAQQEYRRFMPEVQRTLSKRSSSNPNNTRTDIGMPSEREWQEIDGIGGLAQPELGQTGRDGDAANTNSNGQHISHSEHEINASEGRFDAQRDSQQSNGDGNAADTDLQRCNEFNFTNITNKQERQYSKKNIIGKPESWRNFPSVSPVCFRDDGFSDRLDGITFPKWRNESIKAGGNAVVPQVVYQIFKTIEAYEEMGI